MKPFDSILKVLTDRMPRKAAFASLVMIVTLVVFGVLFIFLGGYDDDQIEKNAALKGNLDKVTKNAKMTRDDRQFVLDNKDKYDELLRGDRLVPHTRRVAMSQLQTIALQRGLTTLSSNFTVAANPTTGGAATAAVSGGYRVQVEKVDLKIGASLDTQAYEFMLVLNESFPGSAVIEEFKLDRAPEITTDALNQVARGKDSGLVRGELRFTWRTAQAQETENAAAAPPPRGRQ